MSAVGTWIAMTAECGGAAACDRDQDLLMLPGDPAATAFHKSMNSTANNIGQLQRRPIYGLRICSPGVINARASCGLAVALRLSRLAGNNQDLVRFESGGGLVH